MMHRYDNVEIIEYKVLKSKDSNIFTLYFENNIEAELFFMKFKKSIKFNKEVIEVISVIDNELKIKTSRDIKNIFDIFDVIKKCSINNELNKYLSDFEIQNQ